MNIATWFLLPSRSYVVEKFRERDKSHVLMFLINSSCCDYNSCITFFVAVIML